MCGTSITPIDHLVVPHLIPHGIMWTRTPRCLIVRENPDTKELSGIGRTTIVTRTGETIEMFATGANETVEMRAIVGETWIGIETMETLGPGKGGTNGTEGMNTIAVHPLDMMVRLSVRM